MQLWFAHRADVTLREQLVTQIVLGILCDDLRPGERLPRTHELARRFKLHSNTVSAGYRQLERDGWVEFRRGSGVYVAESRPNVPDSAETTLDQLIVNLFRDVRKLGPPATLVRERLHHWPDLQPPDHFLVIEPREELRRILVLEMQQALALPVKSCSLDPAEYMQRIDGAIPVALARNVAVIQKSLPAADLITVNIRSVPSSLAKWLPSPPGVLVGITSRWPEFLKLARTVLLAAGFEKDVLLFRDARRPNWLRGLEQTAAVVCDSATAPQLPRNCRPIVFPMLSDTSLRELRQYENFVRNPLVPAL